MEGQPINLDEIRQNRIAWIEALESGDYKQGQERLRQKNPNYPGWRYCCLGVACDLTDPNEWEVLSSGTLSKYGLSTRMPPKNLMATRYGIDLHKCRQLAGLNDKRLTPGGTFAQIARKLRLDFGFPPPTA